MRDLVSEDGDQSAELGEQREELITTVYVEAYELDARAGVLDTFVRFITIFGILGSVIFAAVGVADGSAYAPIYLAIGFTAVIFWLIVRVVGAAYVCHLNLMAAQARLHAYVVDD